MTMISTHLDLYNDPNVHVAIDNLVEELFLAEQKHPKWPLDQLRRTSIVAGEAGEALQTSLHVAEGRGDMNHLREEIIQTGAMCLRWLINDLVDMECENHVEHSRHEMESPDNEQPCKFDPKSRYYDAGGIEVQEIIKAKLTNEQYVGFCMGNMIKYLCRANHKGCFDRDLQKAGFYNRFISEAGA